VTKRGERVRVIIGAGKTRIDNWIATQESDLDVLNRKDWERQYELGSIDALLAEHVWEHMSYDEGIEAAKNCFDFLKPGGYIRCGVPDANFDNEWYQNTVQVGGPGAEDHPAYTHKIVYDYRTFVDVFEKAGFVVELLEYCDENKKFHYRYWNEDDGRIGRSFRFDTRNLEDELGMVSLIIDAYKVKCISTMIDE